MGDFPDFNTVLPEPWYWTNEDLTSELHQEMSPQHRLVGVALRTIARRHDRDDVLFEASGTSFSYATAHLTWRREHDPRWPTTAVFKSWTEVAVRIEADARDFC